MELLALHIPGAHVNSHSASNNLSAMSTKKLKVEYKLGTIKGCQPWP